MTGGTLVLADRVLLGQGVMIDCNNYIEIGFDCRISYSCRISDSNHHYVVSAEGNVARTDGKIIIGANNWIGNNSVITKDCVTTDGTICTHGSLLNKNYSKIYDSTHPMLLAGTPAKLIKEGNLRIFSGDIEIEINKYFKDNPDSDIYHLELPLANNVCELRYYL